MAVPIAFTPQPVDLHQELMHRVEGAPREHAEALLGAWDLLQAAHDQGVLEILHGLMGGRDVIAGQLAVLGKSDEAVRIMRNALALGRIVAAFDPDTLQRIAQAVEGKPHLMEPESASKPPGPPSLWSIFKMVRAPDTLRALGFTMGLLNAFGRSMARRSEPRQMPPPRLK